MCTINHTSGFVFCGAYQANAGNEEDNSEYAENDKRFDITCTAWDIDKDNGCINQTSYSEDSK